MKSKKKNKHLITINITKYNNVKTKIKTTFIKLNYILHFVFLINKLKQTKNKTKTKQKNNTVLSGYAIILSLVTVVKCTVYPWMLHLAIINTQTG